MRSKTVLGRQPLSAHLKQYQDAAIVSLAMLLLGVSCRLLLRRQKASNTAVGETNIVVSSDHCLSFVKFDFI